MGLLSRYEPQRRISAVASCGFTRSRFRRFDSSDARMCVKRLKSDCWTCRPACLIGMLCYRFEIMRLEDDRGTLPAAWAVNTLLQTATVLRRTHHG